MNKVRMRAHHHASKLYHFENGKTSKNKMEYHHVPYECGT